MVKRKKDTLDSYVEAMYEASSILMDKKPDYIVAPMMGSVPFVDAMSIVNNSFDPTKVVYMPASSRIDNVNHVIRSWYERFLEDVCENHERDIRVIGIDEVVSGNSVVRCIKNIDIASNKFRRNLIGKLILGITSLDKEVSLETLTEIDDSTNYVHSGKLSEFKRRIESGFYSKRKDVAKEDLRDVTGILKEDISKMFVYRTVGIQDSKSDGKRGSEYMDYVKQERVIPVNVKTILSMDIPDFCPPRYKELDVKKGRGDYVAYSPIIEGFNVSPRYLEFLSAIARKVGQDPITVNPINMQRIMESNKYLY